MPFPGTVIRFVQVLDFNRLIHRGIQNRDIGVAAGRDGAFAWVHTHDARRIG